MYYYNFIITNNTIHFWPNIPFKWLMWCYMVLIKSVSNWEGKNYSGSTLVEMIILTIIPSVPTVCQVLLINLHILLQILMTVWYKHYCLW